jgi:hypothetical protein
MSKLTLGCKEENEECEEKRRKRKKIEEMGL